MQFSRFLITSVSPSGGEEVEKVDVIKIKFGRHMLEKSINENTIRLRRTNGDLIPCTVQYNKSELICELKPNEVLQGGYEYQVECMGREGGIESVDGLLSDISRVYEFNVKDIDTVLSPTIESISLNTLFLNVHFSHVDSSEPVWYEMKLSIYKNAEADSLWETNHKIQQSPYCISEKVNAKQTYYIHMRSCVEDYTSEWVTSSFYTEHVGVEVTEGNDIENVYIIRDSNGDIYRITVVDGVLHKEKVSEVEGDIPEIVVPEEVMKKIDVLDWEPKLSTFHNEQAIYVILSDIPKEPLLEDETYRDKYMYVVEETHKPYSRMSAYEKVRKYSRNKALQGGITFEEGNVMVWKPKDKSNELQPNTNYSVFIGCDVIEDASFGFRFAPAHFHGDLEEIKAILYRVGLEIEDHEIVQLMMDYSQYACDIWFETEGYEEELHTNTSSPYFIDKYVNTQTLIQLIVRNMFAGVGAGNERSKLGDLEIERGAGDPTLFKNLLDKLEKDLKKWEDLIHNHHNRGYAKPTVAMKAENVEQYPDFFTRVELKSFDK